MHYVYLLRLSNNDIYVGYTKDLNQRIQTHNNGHVPATAQLLPATLKSYIAVKDKETANALEKYLKTASGRAFAKKRF